MAVDPMPVPPPARPARRRRWCWSVLGATSCLWLAWAIGQAARDANWLTGLCFYIPSPVMAGVGLAAGVLLLARGDRRFALALGCMAIPPAASVLLVENQWARPAAAREPRPGTAARFVHWNIAYGRWEIERVNERLLRERAELYVLSEVPRPYPLSDLAARLGPGYDSVRLGSMAFLARGRLRDPERLVNTKELKVNRVTWHGRHGPLKLFGVDLTSDLLVPRDPLLRRLRALMEAERPDLVAGDFNAPRRSRALWPLPRGFSHAYLAAGRGWSYTWPVPCPLYALDQCILSSAIRPSRYDLAADPASDHRIQLMEFLVDRSPP